jgi:hypothetical protein
MASNTTLCANNVSTNSLTTSGVMTSHFLNYLTSDPFGLTVDDFTDADIDQAAGHADNDLVANTFASSDYDAGGAGNATLPAAIKDTVIIYQQGEEADGSNVALTFTCAGTDTFVADCAIYLGTGGATQSDVSVATDVSIAITLAGTNDTWGGVGSTINFYCPEDGKWRVKIGNIVPTGSGAPGTLATFA